MDRMTVKWYVVSNHIPALILSVESNARAQVMKAASLIVRDAKMFAPVQTGFLRSSIRSVSVATGKEADVVVGAEYGRFVEFGTYKMAAQPFLSPAVARHEREFFDSIGKGFFKGWSG